MQQTMITDLQGAISQARHSLDRAHHALGMCLTWDAEANCRQAVAHAEAVAERIEAWHDSRAAENRAIGGRSGSGPLRVPSFLREVK